MQKAEYTKMFEMEDSHFWFVAKRNFIDSVLEGRFRGRLKILDLGAGTGGTTKHLEKYGKVSAIESLAYAVRLAKKRGVNIKIGNLNRLNLPKNTYDLVTLFDVLYHQDIKSETQVLQSAASSLKKGGYLLVTDSAFGFLKSPHDIATRGARRYKISDLKMLAEKSGFKVLKSGYIFCMLFPLVLTKRLFIDKLLGNKSSDVAKVNPLINSLLISLLKFEAKLFKYISFPFGTSVVILAVKK